MRSELGRPLTEEELNLLEEFLASGDRHENCMDFSMLDGFLAAIAIRPDLVLPGTWIPEVWGSDEGGAYRDIEEANHVLSILMRYYNDVAYHLRDHAETFEPVFYERTIKGKTVRIVDEWCIGFIRGLRLQNPAWVDWLRDSALMELLGPFLLLGTEIGWDEMKQSGREAKLHAETVPLLQPSLVLLSRKWRQTPAPIATAVSTRVGRNELCSCGSGKKYKRCCGLN